MQQATTLYRGAILIPQYLGYLLEGLALLAHGTRKFHTLIVLLASLRGVAVAISAGI